MDAESLFRAHFLPLYPDDARRDLAGARRTDANPGRNPALTAHLEEAGEIFAARAPAMFGGDALGERLDFSDASVHRLSAALTPERRDAWARGAEPELFNVVIHGAAYVGECIRRNHGGAWSVRRPLWESMIALRSRAGDAELAVFHWWLKSLADDALAGTALTLADRYRTHVEIPCARPEELPVLAAADRALPRLEKVRYDTLFQYLKAHVPELRDLGADFPTPERFGAYGFKSLGFLLVGGGRMLVLHGQDAHGVHLFWLTRAGFEKSAFFPADTFPEHRLTASGEKLVLLVNVEKKLVTHEMLWWGP
jgi:hypothetical protein